MDSNEQEYRDKIIDVIRQHESLEYLHKVDLIEKITRLSSAHFATPKMEVDFEENGVLKIKNVPEKIYLTTGLEYGEDEVDFNNLHEVTWCDQSIFETDIKYIREDLIQPLLSASTQIRNELSDEEIRNEINEEVKRHFEHFKIPKTKNRVQLFKDGANWGISYRSELARRGEGKRK